MQIKVNGKKHDVPEHITIRELLVHLGYTNSFVAVARNSDCIARQHYDETCVEGGDMIEILAPMAGG